MKNKLYNVLFPIWVLVFFPIFWIVALPANFLIDTIVLLISLKFFKITDVEKTYKSSILKIWGFGFIADFIGATIITSISQIQVENEAVMNVVNAISNDPFSNILAIIIIGVVLVLSAAVIYVLDFKFAFFKIKLDASIKKKLALTIAIFTAPYLFFMPAKYLYKDVDVTINTHNNESAVENEFSGDALTSRIFAESRNYTNTDFTYIDKISKVNSDIVESSKGSIVNMRISTNFDGFSDLGEYKKWAKQCSIIVFIKQSGIDEVVVNLKNLENEQICNLSYLKSDLESEYGVKLSDLENDSQKLQEILDSIK